MSAGIQTFTWSSVDRTQQAATKELRETNRTRQHSAATLPPESGAPELSVLQRACSR